MERSNDPVFIAQPNPTIVPGGRFLETYYWDTYWVVQGLIVCNMLLVVRLPKA